MEDKNMRKWNDQVGGGIEREKNERYLDGATIGLGRKLVPGTHKDDPS